MRILVTGGAGFIGSHLCRAYLDRGDQVVAVDDFSTGLRENLAGLPLELVEHDMCRPLALSGPIDIVLHLASPASPAAYQARPLETLEVNSNGTRHALELARVHGARFVLASTSEVYGDAEEHPQAEGYRGSVNPVGPRSMYNEAKRFAEALTVNFGRVHGVAVGIVRLFNTYGPRMQPDDGRVVTNFLAAIRDGRPLIVHGVGEQTRSFCYVSDTVAGLMAMADCRHQGPINLGNPDEFTILGLIREIEDLTGRQAELEFRPLPGDDPRRRCPDITLARNLLAWGPRVPLREGLRRTWAWLTGPFQSLP
jgi:dTDP-glucose 4,6-dehydratase